MNPPQPRLLDRVLCVANYLGLAPLTRLSQAKRQELFFAHHFMQAMAVFFCLLLAIPGFLLFGTAECLFALLFPNTSQQILDRWSSLVGFIEYATWLPILALAVIWITPMGFALCASTRPLPLLKQLSRRPWVVRLSLFSNSLMLALAPVIAAWVLHANSLTRTCHDGASVYFLYDEGVGVPRWGFSLGMYRISLQAERNWGKGCTVVDRLNRDTLRTALASGRVVILATHGEKGYAVTYYAPEYLCIGAPDKGATDGSKGGHFLRMKVLGPDNTWGKWENVAANPNLELAYIFACHGGERASQWEEHLAPAKVITYDRFSTVFDHAYWFAIAGPKILTHLR